LLDVNFTTTLLATAGGDGATKIWDVKEGKNIATLALRSGSDPPPAKGCAWSHGDGKLLTVTTSGFGNYPQINIYNTTSKDGTVSVDGIEELNNQANLTHGDDMGLEPVMTIQSEDKDVAITMARWGPTNDTIYYSSEDGYMVVVDANTGKSIVEAPIHGKSINRFNFDEEYNFLVTASVDGTSKLLDVRTLEVVKTYRNDRPVNDAVISPTMDHVLVGGGQDAQSVTNSSHGGNKFEAQAFHKIFENQLGSIPCHFGPINGIAINPSGSGFSTGGEDGLIKMHTFDKEHFTKEGMRELEIDGEVQE